MADFSNETLRKKVSTVFSDLFHENKDVLFGLEDFFFLKTAKKSPQNLVLDDDSSGGDDIVDTSVHEDDVPADFVPPPVTESPTRNIGKQGDSIVKGQSIFQLVDQTTDGGPAPWDNMRFSNGAGVDLEHNLHSFVECPIEKLRSEKIFQGERYVPSDSLIVASVNCFSRKKKQHFFRDGLYLCSVFAKEMSMSLSTFLEVRGWLVTVKKGTVSISYRRIGDCLSLLEEEAAANYFRLSAMFDHLYRVINSREIWPSMPYENSE
jgi:hypothetical protein